MADFDVTFVTAVCLQYNVIAAASILISRKRRRRRQYWVTSACMNTAYWRQYKSTDEMQQWAFTAWYFWSVGRTGASSIRHQYLRRRYYLMSNYFDHLLLLLYMILTNTTHIFTEFHGQLTSCYLWSPYQPVNRPTYRLVGPILKIANHFGRTNGQLLLGSMSSLRLFVYRWQVSITSITSRARGAWRHYCLRSQEDDALIDGDDDWS